MSYILYNRFLWGTWHVDNPTFMSRINFSRFFFCHSYHISFGHTYQEQWIGQYNFDVQIRLWIIFTWIHNLHSVCICPCQNIGHLTSDVIFPMDEWNRRHYRPVQCYTIDTLVSVSFMHLNEHLFSLISLYI